MIDKKITRKPFAEKQPSFLDELWGRCKGIGLNSFSWYYYITENYIQHHIQMILNQQGVMMIKNFARLFVQEFLFWLKDSREKSQKYLENQQYYWFLNCFDTLEM